MKRVTALGATLALLLAPLLVRLVKAQAPSQGSGNTWSTMSPMPTPRYYLAAATDAGGKIYAIGGFSNLLGLIPTNEVYDPATNIWSTAAPMPTARYYLAAVSLGGKIYAIGGFVLGGTGTNLVEVYDPAADTWSTAAPMPTARYGLAAVVVGGKIYALGGAGTFALPMSTVEVYDPATNSWTAAAPLPTARAYPAAGVDANGRIYAIGGFNAGQLNTVDLYDPATNTWSAAPPMSNARDSLAAATDASGKIYAMGGNPPGSVPLQVVEVYDPSASTWSTVAPMPTARFGLAAVSDAGKIYAIGGLGQVGSAPGTLAVNTVEQYSPLVTTAPTTTGVTTSASPSVFGQQVSFTATVNPTQASALTPTGTATFNDGSTVLGTVALSSGTAILNTAGLAVGTHAITASYGGDNQFGSSTSSALNQAVNGAATSTALVVSPNPANFGQTVTFTATVTVVAPGAGTPTGTVKFLDAGGTLGTGAVNSAGNATFSSSSLTQGSHSITAVYGGDTNFVGSSSSSVNQVVSQPATSTALAASPNPANLGQTVTFTATVNVAAPGVGAPTGTVTFLDGPTTLGIGVLGPGGTATLSTSSLAVGSHTVTASYGGDATFAGSTSTGVIVIVQGPPPPVQITDNETIHVADSESFPDVFDPENVKVADAVWVTPLIQVSAPVVEFSAGSIGFSGQSGSQTITVSDIGLASLTLTSATISGSSQFTVTQVACSNSATSLSTVLPSGGVCAVTIGYTASGTPSNDNATLLFTDNAALSNLASIPAGSNYTQSIPLNGSGTTAPPPPPPPAVVSIPPILETIKVTDTSSFPDVFDAEAVHVTDAVFVTPLIQVSAPVAEFSAGTLGFSGQSGSQAVTVSDIGTSPLLIASATISGNSQFAITQITCSNSAPSFSTTLPSGGACVVTIGYTASATPASDYATLVFTDNAALSNVVSTSAGSSYTQSIPLNGSGTTIAPPPPPPAVVPVMDTETIHVTDTESFPDVFDPEAVKVTDAVWVTPLIQVAAPVAEFSAGSLGFNGQSGSQTITVSDTGTASLTVSSATISGSSQFSITQTTCSNGAISFSTVLPSGGACVLTIGYSASATPPNDNGILMFADNAALSNLASIPAGSSFTQSIPLSGAGSTTGPPPPPPAVIPIMDSETIHVTDTPSFPDVFDPEKITVTDQVSVIPCDFTVSANSPVSIPVGGSGSAGITLTAVNGCNQQVNVSASAAPNGVSLSLSSSTVNVPAGGAASTSLTVSAGPSVTPTSFTVTITGTSGLIHSASVSVNITASLSGTIGVVQTLTNAGAINNVGIANALTSKLSAAQSAGSPQTSINTLKAFQNQVQAQAGQHIATSFTLAGVTFNPASTLMANGQALIDSFRVSMIPDPITGYVVNSSGMAVPGATVSIADATGNIVASATSDVTGFYYMATTGGLTPGATYTLAITGLPAGFTSASPSSQAFTWQGAAVAFSNFVLN